MRAANYRAMWVIAATLLWLQFTVCKHALVSQVMKGDTMHIASEPFKPRPELVRLVESCLERISPDAPHLTEWFRSYAMNHKTRIAFDIDIVREIGLRTPGYLNLARSHSCSLRPYQNTATKLLALTSLPTAFNRPSRSLGLPYSDAT